jgi:uncharacterized protein
VVATLPSLQDLTIEDFGYQLGRHWGIGQAGKDNGALLIVAPEEREVRIEVGYGLEGELTDALSRTIIESRILPHFRQDDFAAGIKAGVAGMIGALGGTYDPALPPARGRAEAPFPLPIFMAMAILLIWLANRIFSPRRGGPRTPAERGRRRRQVFLPGGFSGGGGGFGRGGGGGGGGFGGGGGGFGGGGASGRW